MSKSGSAKGRARKRHGLHSPVNLGVVGYVKDNGVPIMIGLSGFIAATAVVSGWVTPVTDPLIGRPPFANQVALEDTKRVADKALAQAGVLGEAVLGIQLDRAQNQLVQARDRASREPMNPNAQVDVLRAETVLKQTEERLKQYLQETNKEPKP